MLDSMLLYSDIAKFLKFIMLSIIHCLLKKVFVLHFSLEKKNITNGKRPPEEICVDFLQQKASVAGSQPVGECTQAPVRFSFSIK